MTGLATLIAVPSASRVAIFAIEVGGGLARAARFLIDVLAGLPSIVVGIFVYASVVVTQGHFSGLAGSLALAIVMLPGRDRVGRGDPAPHARVHRRGSAGAGPVALACHPLGLRADRAVRASSPACLLGVSRAIGETAPLIFTSLGNNFFTLDLNQPMQALPLLIYRNALNSAFASARDRAFGAALLLDPHRPRASTLPGRWLTARRRLAGSTR